MARFEDFASWAHPLHCSQIPNFLACPWSHLMKFLGISDREGASSANTGSAVHTAICAWHRLGKEVETALNVMRASDNDYPLADFGEAEKLFRLYAADPRNQNATVVYTERHFKNEISKGVVLEGTVDQIREEEARYRVYDLKTSKKSGALIRDFHTYQLAAYAVLASETFGREVEPGAVLMVRGYLSRSKEDKVYWPYSLTLDDCRRLMQTVCERVRDARAGRIQAVPGEHCSFCVGVPACVSSLKFYTS